MLKRNGLVIIILCSVAFLTSSCTDPVILSALPNRISSFGSFVHVWFLLQLSVLLSGLILSLFFGKGAAMISLVGHFIWIVWYRDYGFGILLLMFIFNFIMSFLLTALITRLFNRNS